MSLPKCPLCNNEIKIISDNIIANGFIETKCTNHSTLLSSKQAHIFYIPYFSCRIYNNDQISFSLNIEVDDKFFGFDSYNLANNINTKIIYFNEDRITSEILADLPYFIPPHEARSTIQRIYNLKAFL